jgi:hypothetical protein
MARGVLRRIGVVQVCHALVPLLGHRPAQVRPGNEGLHRPHLDLRLEGVGAVGVFPVGLAAIDQED